MPETYALDLENFSLAKFRTLLEDGNVLPSRRILLEDLPERFARIEAAGISNLKQLVTALSTPKKIEHFAVESGVPIEYLEMLKRQTKIYTPAPNPLKDIPDVGENVLQALEKAGIRQTKQLFERAKTRAGRDALAAESGVPAQTLLELVALSDLSRAGWVGPIFARLIYESGTQTLEALACADPAVLYERILAVNRERNYTRASFTVKDVASCIEIAAMMTHDLEI